MLRLFGNNLASLRRVKNLTVGQLAERLDCHPSYVTHVEKGRRLPPRAEQFDRLVTALCASKDEATQLRQAAIWTVVVNRVEDLGYDRPEVLVHAAATAIFRPQ